MRSIISLCCLLAIVAGAAPQMPLRFSLRTATLDLSQCLAQPGNIAVPVAPEETNIEIVDWTSAPSNAMHEAEFVLRMNDAVAVGCIILYGKGEVSCLVDQTWKPVNDPREKGRLLRFLVPEAGDFISAIRIAVPATAATAKEGKPVYQATLPFLTLFPVRAINVAMNAAVTTGPRTEAAGSSSGNGDPGVVIDGVIHPVANFSTPKRAEPMTAEAPEWVQLTFPEMQSIRGIGLFRGRAEHGFGQATTEIYAGKGKPPEGVEGWQAVKGLASAPGKFRSNELLVFRESLDAKAIRIRAAGVHNIALGELVILEDLGYAPVPEPKPDPDSK